MRRFAKGPSASLFSTASPLKWVNLEIEDTPLVLVGVCGSNIHCLIDRSPIDHRQHGTVRARNSWGARCVYFRLCPGRHNND
jgi:hypothetical protein